MLALGALLLIWWIGAFLIIFELLIVSSIDLCKVAQAEAEVEALL